MGKAWHAHVLMAHACAMHVCVQHAQAHLCTCTRCALMQVGSRGQHMHVRTRHKVVADELVDELGALEQLVKRHALHVREPLGDGLPVAWQQENGHQEAGSAGVAAAVQSVGEQRRCQSG